MRKMTATYRLQVNKDFTLQDAAALVPYLKTLGISHVYLSPIMEAVKNSPHGYDVIDFAKISAERGGEAGLAALDRALADHDMGFILDIVPNHMGIEGKNPYWFDILIKGRDSEHWDLFDLRVPAGEKLHLPILPTVLEDAVRADVLQPAIDDHYGAGLRIGERYLPFAPETVPAGFDQDYPPEKLIALIQQQHYLPVCWKESEDRLDYRRFFAIMDLVGIRAEDPMVFEKTHQKLFEIAGKYRSLTGVRVDHIDGLVDPLSYLQRLSSHFSNIWVEKILARGEKLPPDWPVRGTTGYEFIDMISRVFVPAAKFNRVKTAWCARAGASWPDFHSAVLEAKAHVLTSMFPSELDRLIRLSITEDTEYQTAALFWTGMTVCLPVYRTYIYKGALSDADKAQIEQACRTAEARYGDDFKQAAAQYLNMIYAPETKTHRQALNQWQQLSGPVMAKGLEDTAHYRFTPLTALNEVGGEAEIPGQDKTPFFKALQNRAAQWPLTMNASSSHDTKRSEDTRSRIYALARDPAGWTVLSDQLQALYPDEHIPPEVKDFLFQAIIGIWPFSNKIDKDHRERLQAYMQKSLRERGLETGWQPPEAEFEKRVDAYVRAVLSNEDFQAIMGHFAEPVARTGALNTLSVLMLKILTPGLPDFYQGSEMWDFSLVDPDNRRPVDFECRKSGLSRLADIDQSQGRPALLASLKSEWQTGAIKLWLTPFLLSCRRDLFPKEGLPHLREIVVSGRDRADFLVWSLEDRNGKALLYAIAPRNILPDAEFNLGDLKAEITLPECRVTNLMDQAAYKGGAVQMADLLRDFPLAVLRPV